MFCFPLEAPVLLRRESSAIFLLPTVSLVILSKTEFWEWTMTETQPVPAIQASIQPKMDHASNQTATLIPSALSANKGSDSASNALPLKTELLSFLKASASVWMGTTQMPITTVFLAQVDAWSASQPPFAQVVLPSPIPLLLLSDSAIALKRPSLLLARVEQDIVRAVVPIVPAALAYLLAYLVKILS